MIGWMRKNNRAARAARTLSDLFEVSAKQWREIFIFEGYVDNTSLQQ